MKKKYDEKINDKIKYKFNFKFILFLIIPIILIFIFINLNSARGPYYLGSNSDPEYAYLLNSLKISQFKTPSHIDHPGTTLQLIGGFVIRTLNINKNNEYIQTDVLINSENYLSYINIFLLFIIVILTILLGIYTYNTTGNIYYGIILQSSILYSSITYVELTRVRPEYLLIISSLLISATLISLLKNNLLSNIKKYIFIFSLICGFGMATKIIFFPLLFIALLLIPKFKNKIYFILGTLISFILFTIPIIGQYGRFYTWIKNLFLHSGAYGTGATTIINPSLYFNNIQLAISNNVIFSSTLILSIILIAICLIIPKYRKNTYSSMEFKILISLSITQLIQILLVSKYYSSHYLIPSLMLTGVTIIFFIINIKKIINIKFTKYYYVGIIIPIIIFLYYSIGAFFTLSYSLEKNKNEYLQIINAVQNNYRDYTKIYYYRSSFHEYALKFGNDFSGNEYSFILNKIYPNNYFYNIWDNKYYDFGKMIDFNNLIINKVIYEGTSFEKNYPNTTFKPNILIEDVYGGKNETIYLFKK